TGAHCAERRPQAELLDVAEDLTQATPLVEAAAEVGERRVVVRVYDRRLRHEGLGHPGPEHLAGQEAVLGIGDLAEGNALPGPAGQTAVGARVEARAAVRLRRPWVAVTQAVDDRPAVRRERREPLVELASDSHRRARAGPVGAEGDAHVPPELECFEQPPQPGPVRRRRVL